MALFAEGPIPKGECQKCHRYCTCDIYRYQGRILCGDCRYEACQAKIQAAAITGGFGSQTLHRLLKFEAFSERHVAFINEWIDSFKLSLE